MLKRVFLDLQKARQDTPGEYTSITDTAGEEDDAEQRKTAITDRLHSLEESLMSTKATLDKACGKLGAMNQALNNFMSWLEDTERKLRNISPHQVSLQTFEEVAERCNVSVLCLSVCLFLCLQCKCIVSVCLSVSVSVCLSVCLSVSVSVYLSIICLSVCLSVRLCFCVCLSVCLFVRPSMFLCLSVCLSVFCVCLSICLSVCLSIYVSSVCPSIRPSVCLSTHPSIH